MKIHLYQLLPEMQSHSFPLMLSILPTAERRSNVREIENEIGVVVVAIRTGIGIGIVGIGIVLPERRTTITTIDHHGGGSMNEMTITSIEGTISMANPNLDGMKMSIVLGIVIVTSAIVIGNSDRTGQETGETGTEEKGTEATETETEAAKTTEETETETGKRKGNEETGIGVTGTEETGTEEIGSEEIGSEETGIRETRIRDSETERNLINHKPRRLVKARLLRRQQLVILLDPSSKKCLLLTLIATVLYLHLQRQALDLV